MAEMFCGNQLILTCSSRILIASNKVTIMYEQCIMCKLLGLIDSTLVTLKDHSKRF